MRFVPLFSVQLTHPYYADGRCPDFSMTPSSDTQRLLSNHRCVLKAGPDGIRVFCPLDGAGQPLIPMGQDARFVFHLRLVNPDFALFTDLAGMAGNEAPVYTNASLGTADEKRLSLTVGAGRPACFADVEMHNNDSLAPIDGDSEEGAANAFQAGFEARAFRWAYYCLIDPEKTGEVSIVDGETAGALVFGDENRTDLADSPDATDEVATVLAEQYPEARALRFVSDQPIPCRQSPRSHLQVYLDDDKLADGLPNPSFRNYAKTKVSVNGVVQQHDALFQIVNLLTSNI